MEGVAIWRQIEGDDTILLDQLKIRNGKIIKEDIFDESEFVAYYPNEDFLVLIGGHSCDIGYNLTTDESIETLGLPDLRKPSPSETYSVIGYYDCQSMRYRLLEHDGERYVVITNLTEIENPLEERILSMENSFWTSDSTFYYQDTEMGDTCYRMTIK